jgi:transcriptional regulator with XRE-family HTH domain
VQVQIPPLRGAREARGKSLRQVARQVPMDPAHLSRIERGLAVPSVAVLRRLAEVLELPELERFLAPYQKSGR